MVQKTILIKSLEKTFKKVEGLLHRNGFKTATLESERALRKFIYETIPDNCIVGLGNSLSSSALKIRNILLEKGNKVYYNWNGLSQNRNMDTYEDMPRPDYFLTIADTITRDGSLINKEYSKEALKNYQLPKNIIAFTHPDKIKDKISQSGLSSDFTVLNKRTENSDVTVALMHFASAS